MATITFIEKTNGIGEPKSFGRTIKVDGAKLEGISTKSLCIRKAHNSENKYLSERAGGVGNYILNIDIEQTYEVSKLQFQSFEALAKKANAIIL